jgi:hypothetical protein
MRPVLIPPIAGDLTWQSPQEAWQLRQEPSKTFLSKISASAFENLGSTPLRCPAEV